MWRIHIVIRQQQLGNGVVKAPCVESDQILAEDIWGPLAGSFGRRPNFEPIPAEKMIYDIDIGRLARFRDAGEFDNYRSRHCGQLRLQSLGPLSNLTEFSVARRFPELQLPTHILGSPSISGA